MFGQQMPGTLHSIPNEKLRSTEWSQEFFGYGPYKSVIICIPQNSRTFRSVSANMSLATLPTSAGMVREFRSDGGRMATGYSASMHGDLCLHAWGFVRMILLTSSSFPAVLSLRPLYVQTVLAVARSCRLVLQVTS